VNDRGQGHVAASLALQISNCCQWRQLLLPTERKLPQICGGNEFGPPHGNLQPMN